LAKRSTIEIEIGIEIEIDIETNRHWLALGFLHFFSKSFQNFQFQERLSKIVWIEDCVKLENSRKMELVEFIFFLLTKFLDLDAPQPDSRSQCSGLQHTQCREEL